MKNWPTDPLRQHNRIVAAFCDDLLNGHRSLSGPAVTRVAEINRQVNETHRETVEPNKPTVADR